VNILIQLRGIISSEVDQFGVRVVGQVGQKGPETAQLTNKFQLLKNHFIKGLTGTITLIHILP